MYYLGNPRSRRVCKRGQLSNIGRYYTMKSTFSRKKKQFKNLYTYFDNHAVIVKIKCYQPNIGVTFWLVST